MSAPSRPDRPWEPEALRLPLESPSRRTHRPLHPSWQGDGDDDGDDERERERERERPAGSHVIVIDIG
ncbi:MAG: hypothetical protein H6708_13725 [Kofleriaceae bacterium]|nr:hypothetical protein [Kofleriaceae bacterium]